MGTRDEGIWDSEQERGCQEGYSQVEDDLVNREGSLLGNRLQGALSPAGELNRLVGGRAVFLCKADLFKFFRTEQAPGKLALLLKSLEERTLPFHGERSYPVSPCACSLPQNQGQPRQRTEGGYNHNRRERALGLLVRAPPATGTPVGEQARLQQAACRST